MDDATIRQIDASVQDEALRHLAEAARQLDISRTAARNAAKELEATGRYPKAHRDSIGVMAAADTALGSIAEATSCE